MSRSRPPAYPTPSKAPPAYPTPTKPPAGAPPTSGRPPTPPPSTVKPPRQAPPTPPPGTTEPPSPPQPPAVASPPAPWKRVVFILLAAFVAHVLASYICMFFTVYHVRDVLSAYPGTPNPIGRWSKIGAPIRVFRVLENWRHLAVSAGTPQSVAIDTPQGVALLWFCYLAPLVVFFVAIVLAPKYLFVEDRKQRGRRY